MQLSSTGFLWGDEYKYRAFSHLVTQVLVAVVMPRKLNPVETRNNAS